MNNHAAPHKKEGPHCFSFCLPGFIRKLEYIGVGGMFVLRSLIIPNSIPAYYKQTFLRWRRKFFFYPINAAITRPSPTYTVNRSSILKLFPFVAAKGRITYPPRSKSLILAIKVFLGFMLGPFRWGLELCLERRRGNSFSHVLQQLRCMLLLLQSPFRVCAQKMHYYVRLLICIFAAAAAGGDDDVKIASLIDI